MTNSALDIVAQRAQSGAGTDQEINERTEAMSAQDDERHRLGMEAARAVARWELGDGWWADKLVGAYLEPERALEALRKDQEGFK